MVNDMNELAEVLNSSDFKLNSFQRQSLNFLSAFNCFRDSLINLGIPITPLLKKEQATVSATLGNFLADLHGGAFCIFTDDSANPLHDRHCTQLRLRLPIVPLFAVDSSSVVGSREAAKRVTGVADRKSTPVEKCFVDIFDQELMSNASWNPTQSHGDVFSELQVSCITVLCWACKWSITCYVCMC